MAEAKQSATSAAVQSQAPVVNEGMQYVTIPKKTVLGWDHPGIGINLKHWGPGTHLVSDAEAGEINRMLERHNTEQIRILRPEVDRVAEAKSREFIG
jgi:hypothetical protein